MLQPAQGVPATIRGMPSLAVAHPAARRPNQTIAVRTVRSRRPLRIAPLPSDHAQEDFLERRPRQFEGANGYAGAAKRFQRGHAISVSAVDGDPSVPERLAADAGPLEDFARSGGIASGLDLEPSVPGLARAEVRDGFEGRAASPRQ